VPLRRERALAPKPTGVPEQRVRQRGLGPKELRLDCRDRRVQFPCWFLKAKFLEIMKNHHLFMLRRKPLHLGFQSFCELRTHTSRSAPN